MDLELKLHREALRNTSYPHITRRLVQNHLGQQWYVYRIEITILGEEFYHTSTEVKEHLYNEYKMLTFCNTILRYLNKGKVLNLEYWTRIEYTY